MTIYLEQDGEIEMLEDEISRVLTENDKNTCSLRLFSSPLPKPELKTTGFLVGFYVY